ncbi:glycoside hydrolase N-terminal domain-containing protein [Kitasatospora sp. NA04385]|uniref:glycosyl hydrolase family 95 catalytic domain-containing protein n=1 Tax=Kitasatospora sp. NA04385 TaxID=2742135 RepID=UPI00158FE3F7|nr:glycoside hydrolase N-terminal domain-containing protein [Kitasatospora sp. NA04385]QKW17813.1 glycoside hydrolase N-terminal domain-containing protein [Kitasatospora sp. NA04385]
MSPDGDRPRLSRRDLLRFGGGLGAAVALAGIPVFTATARADAARPAGLSLVPAADATTFWYASAGNESKIIEEGLPIGNGRIGALVTGDPANDALYITDASLWTGTLNASLTSSGQFPYDTTNFGTMSLLAKAYVKVPAHTAAAVGDYRRRLDLSNGYVSASYTLGGVTYQREAYASHPDDVVIVRLTQSGGGTYTGSVALNGTHGESTTADSAAKTASFSGALGNGLKYGAVAAVRSTGGTVSVSGAEVTFTGCSEVVIVLSAGTNYVPDPAKAFKDAAVDPKAVATAKATSATAVTGTALLATHVDDYRKLYERMTVSLGTSTAAQKAMATPARLAARAVSGAAPDPELEASYLQFGRYLTITGSRTGLPTNLQGLWFDKNNPSWMGDYHTDINVQMNYWLPDRAGLSECFVPLADYCLSQLSSWTTQTQQLFNDPRNGFRNTSGKVAGWTTAISTNIYGGMGWWWHPAGNAWLCNSLFEHYEHTRDAAYLARIHPMLKGACQFWEARLITTTVTENGVSRQVLIDDSDWSPEQGPSNAKGITYAQELVWQLFQNYRDSCAALGLDAAYATTVADLQSRLYLPQVSPSTGWLEEWMTDANLGETTHRHLSPLVGFSPGDRITHDRGPVPTLIGVRNLLTARGMQSFGWATAWRAMCWARLKHADNAYQLILTVLKPSVNYSNGASINLLDMYSFGTSSTLQIDANYGTPTAMLDMLAYSRPGLVELLPATPSAWGTGSVRGLGLRGGFTLDMDWSGGQVTSATLHSTGGTSTRVKFGTWSQAVTMAKGGSATLTPPAKATTFLLVNRRSGKVIDVPGSSTTAGTGLIQYTRSGSANQRWKLTDLGCRVYTLANVNSSLLASVNGGTSADDATIIQWTNGGSTNQQWMLTDTGDGYVKIVNVRSGKVLGVRGNSTANSAVIVQQTDTDDLSQQWSMVAV